MKTEIQFLTDELLDRVTAEARQAARLRKNFNFHASAADNPHRMLNVLCRGTYVQPHRHLDPPKAESFIALRGSAGIVTFNTDGEVTGRHVITAGAPVFGLDIAAGVIHTVVALSDVFVCYEVKPGPWDPATDKDFAAWAPAEGEDGAREFVRRMEALFGSDPGKFVSNGADGA